MVTGSPPGVKRAIAHPRAPFRRATGTAGVGHGRDLARLGVGPVANWRSEGMERWHGFAEGPRGWGAPGGCVVTVGFFDGVHQGHQRVVRRAVALARERG